MSEPGALARGPETALFPFPDFPEHDKEVIEKAIGVAWSRLQARYDLKALDEVQINDALKVELNCLLDESPSPVPAYNPERFDTVERDSQFPNYNGRLLKKTPDLRFRHCGRKHPGVIRDYHALFVECKIVDSTDGRHHMGFYAADGLIRFVKGDYAWAMPSGIMIGYVRDGSSSVPVELTKHLREAKSPPNYRVKALPTRCTWGTAYESRHGRTFKVDNKSPGDIVVVHIWLRMR